MPGYRKAVAILMLAVTAWYSEARAGDAPTYSISIVPQFDLRRIEAIWRPIIERLEPMTGFRFHLVMEPTIPAFEKALNAGAYDFAYMNPYHYVVAHRLQGYQPIVRDVENDLYGVVVVAKGAGLSNVAMLDGRKVAFPAPNAMGASLIPRAEFVRKFHIKISEVYVKSHDSAYLNVLLGQTDAAGGIRATFDQLKPEIRDGLTIIHETDRFPPHPLAAHPRVPAAAVLRVQKALLELGQDRQGVRLLANVPIKSVGPASDQEYETLRHLGLEAFYVDQ